MQRDYLFRLWRGGRPFAPSAKKKGFRKRESRLEQETGIEPAGTSLGSWRHTIRRLLHHSYYTISERILQTKCTQVLKFPQKKSAAKSAVRFRFFPPRVDGHIPVVVFFRFVCLRSVVNGFQPPLFCARTFGLSVSVISCRRADLRGGTK